MGFFAIGTAKDRKPKSEINPKLITQLGCKLCPLNHAKINSPKMPPSGSKNPLFYFLGEAPGSEEDIQNKQFVGKSGQLIRPKIPEKFLNKIRWNNSINCRPPSNRDPEKLELDCCRQRVEGDIEATKPKVLVGFGNIPLRWAIGLQGIWRWRGRRIPLQFGSHKLWFYPTYHPSGLLRQRRNFNGREEPSLDETAFEFDLSRIFGEVDSLPEPKPHSAKDATSSITCISGIRGDKDLDEVLTFLDLSCKAELTGLDLETKRLRPYYEDAKILTVSISLARDNTLAFAWGHPKAGWTAEQKFKLREAFLAYLCSKSRKAVANLAFEQEWLSIEYDKSILRKGLWADTMSQASVLDERFDRKSSPGPLSLEFLVLNHFGFNLKDALLGIGHLDKNNLDKEPIEDVLCYNGADSKYHRELFIIQDELLWEADLLNPYYRKLRQISTCVLTQIKGVPVDPKVTDVLDKKYSNRIEKIEKELFELYVIKQFKQAKGKEFKPGSHPDVEYLLSSILHTNIGRQENGRYKTDEDVLNEVGHPACKLIVRWRKATKQKSTYIDPYRRLYPGNLLHCQFNTVLTETSRLSCEDPNLQNQPKRDKEAKEVRGQVRARKRRIIAAFDYGQIEARVIAMASKDRTWIKMLWERYEVHGEWTERIAYAAPDWVKEPRHEFKSDKSIFKHYRDLVKNQWTFPLFFGASLNSVSHYLGIDAQVLKPLRDEWWKTFAGVKQWQEDTYKFYEKYGYVETLNGFRRRTPLSFNQIVNHPIQGTTCEIVMEAMSTISEWEDWEVHPMLNIHDDLTFELYEDTFDDSAERIIKEMLRTPFDFINVPISVELSIGKGWEKLDEVGTYFSDEWLDHPRKAA